MDRSRNVFVSYTAARAEAKVRAAHMGYALYMLLHVATEEEMAYYDIGDSVYATMETNKRHDPASLVCVAMPDGTFIG